MDDVVPAVLPECSMEYGNDCTGLKTKDLHYVLIIFHVVFLCKFFCSSFVHSVLCFSYAFIFV